MESMEIKNTFGGIYKNKKVLVTGHTGFKGSWLSLWLNELGAEVIGYSNSTPTQPSHFKLLDLDMVSLKGDVRNKEQLKKVVKQYRPDIVFHLAAQSLVRLSYDEPVSTYETNVLGTVNILEAVRKSGNVQAFINVTSDKAYENKEWNWGYRENDRLGGFDPYSNSKACSELVTSAYRNSFFKNNSGTLIASARAGNVIGGGDWAKDRLLPDIFISASKERKVKIRNPRSIRPWQHVLEPLSGYLLLGAKLLNKEKHYADAWNFGPSYDEHYSVEDVIIQIQKHWKKIEFDLVKNKNAYHEANLLKLDCSKAQKELKWKTVWDINKALEATSKWYFSYYRTSKKEIYELSKNDLLSYLKDAEAKKTSWQLKK